MAAKSRGQRELVLEGPREQITPMEYGVMLALVRASGRVMLQIWAAMMSRSRTAFAARTT
jgi:hypothetical protein